MEIDEFIEKISKFYNKKISDDQHSEIAIKLENFAYKQNVLKKVYDYITDNSRNFPTITEIKNCYFDILKIQPEEKKEKIEKFSCNKCKDTGIISEIEKDPIVCDCDYYKKCGYDSKNIFLQDYLRGIYLLTKRPKLCMSFGISQHQLNQFKEMILITGKENKKNIVPF